MVGDGFARGARGLAIFGAGGDLGMIVAEAVAGDLEFDFDFGLDFDFDLGVVATSCCVVAAGSGRSRF